MEWISAVNIIKSRIFYYAIFVLVFKQWWILVFWYFGNIVSLIFRMQNKNHIIFAKVFWFTSEINFLEDFTAYEYLISAFNSLNATAPFLYPLKTSQNLWFSDIFRGYGKRPVAWKDQVFWGEIFSEKFFKFFQKRFEGECNFCKVARYQEF